MFVVFIRRPNQCIEDVDSGRSGVAYEDKGSLDPFAPRFLIHQR